MAWNKGVALRFAAKALVLACLPVFVMIFNLAFDPAARAIDNQKEVDAAEQLVAGKTLVVEGDDWYNILNPGGLKAQYAYRTKGKSDVLVLGSSHATMLSDDLLPGKTVINGAVPGAKLDHLLAVYAVYRRRGILPPEVILGIDPWMLNANFQSASRTSKALDPELAAIGPILGLDSAKKTDPALDYLGIFSFRRSIGALAASLAPSRVLTSEITYRLVDAATADYRSGVRSDGSDLRHALNSQDADPQELRQRVQNSIKRRRGCCFNGFYEMDPTLTENLENFLRLMIQDGVRPTLFLSPEHPDFYEAITTRTMNPIQPKVESHLRALASKYGLRVIGSYDPSKCGLSGASFSDGDHLNLRGFRMIFLEDSCSRAESQR